MTGKQSRYRFLMFIIYFAIIVLFEYVFSIPVNTAFNTPTALIIVIIEYFVVKSDMYNRK